VEWIGRSRNGPFFVYLPQAMPGSRASPHAREAFGGEAGEGRVRGFGGGDRLADRAQSGCARIRGTGTGDAGGVDAGGLLPGRTTASPHEAYDYYYGRNGFEGAGGVGGFGPRGARAGPVQSDRESDAAGDARARETG
jgi:hypothetical protein